MPITQETRDLFALTQKAYEVWVQHGRNNQAAAEYAARIAAQAHNEADEETERFWSQVAEKLLNARPKNPKRDSN